MASITRSLRNASLTLLLVFSLAARSVLAAGIEPVQGQLTPGDEGYVLSAEFAIDLGSRLEETLAHGVPLNFILEFTVERKRWYWFNEQIVNRNIDYRLAYNALTQQYRLTVGGAHSSFASLAEALRSLGHVAGLVAADKTAIRPGNAYVAALRLTLDKSQLPKPLQLDALASKDWQLETQTLRWQFTPGVVGR
jgi:hypothetical protein